MSAQRDTDRCRECGHAAYYHGERGCTLVMPEHRQGETTRWECPCEVGVVRLAVEDLFGEEAAMTDGEVRESVEDLFSEENAMGEATMTDNEVGEWLTTTVEKLWFKNALFRNDMFQWHAVAADAIRSLAAERKAHAETKATLDGAVHMQGKANKMAGEAFDDRDAWRRRAEKAEADLRQITDALRRVNLSSSD